MMGRCVTVYRNPRGQTPARGNRVENTGDLRTVHRESCSGQGVFGTAYQLGPEILAVTVPGEIIPVTLSSSALLSGVTHDPGGAGIAVGPQGGYEIQFALYISADTANTATFLLQHDEENLAGGAWDIPLISGFQIVTGFTMARLSQNSSVRIAMTAASPLAARLTGSNTTALLSVRKLQ
jgi:hypothetical protein